MYVAYSAKSYSEKHVETLVKSVGIAFRPLIIDGHIREAQLQMHEALDLKKDESVIVLDQNLKPILPITGDTSETQCVSAQKYCWFVNLGFIEVLRPIYFDANKKELFGYLDLKIHPDFDPKIIAGVVIMLLIAFIIQALGLVSALGSAANNIEIRLSNWTSLLKNERQIKNANAKPNLISLAHAADNLNLEIERIKKVAADEARTAAQISILKEIGHDLKTPLSQMQKFFSVFVSNIKKAGPVDDVLIGDINSTIDRMRGIVNQTRHLLYDINPDDCNCDLNSETNRILKDLAHDSEILDKKIKVYFKSSAEHNSAKITSIGYYRILENILRNSIHAVGPEGEIWISIFNQSGKVCLSIKDNGKGIPAELNEKIFDFDFSTKLSKGSGMGLGIVKNLCSIFQSKINLTSEVGRGTEFVIEFPSVIRSQAI